jgi:hypothetical protein
MRPPDLPEGEKGEFTLPLGRFPVMPDEKGGGLGMMIGGGAVNTYELIKRLD